MSIRRIDKYQKIILFILSVDIFAWIWYTNFVSSFKGSVSSASVERFFVYKEYGFLIVGEDLCALSKTVLRQANTSVRAYGKDGVKPYFEVTVVGVIARLLGSKQAF